MSPRVAPLIALLSLVAIPAASAAGELEKNAIFVHGMCETWSGVWSAELRDALDARGWNAYGAGAVDQRTSIEEAAADLASALDAHCSGYEQVCQIYALSNGGLVTAYALTAHQLDRWNVLRVNLWGSPIGGTEISGFWSQVLAALFGVFDCHLARQITPTDVRSELLGAGWQNVHDTMFYTYSATDAPPRAARRLTPWGESCRPPHVSEFGVSKLGGCHDLLIPAHSSNGFRDTAAYRNACDGYRFDGYYRGDETCEAQANLWHAHLTGLPLLGMPQLPYGRPCPSGTCELPAMRPVLAAADGLSSVALSWDDYRSVPGGVDEYRIYRATSSAARCGQRIVREGDPDTVELVGPWATVHRGKTGKLDGSATPGVTYYYTMRIQGPDGVSLCSDPVSGRVSCGDGACNNGENCSSCSTDCGACPLPDLSMTRLTWNNSQQGYAVEVCNVGDVPATEAQFNVILSNVSVPYPWPSVTWGVFTTLDVGSCIWVGRIDCHYLDHPDKSGCVGVDNPDLNILVEVDSPFPGEVVEIEEEANNWRIVEWN